MINNAKIKLKLEQIKEESKRNLKRKKKQYDNNIIY